MKALLALSLACLAAEAFAQTPGPVYVITEVQRTRAAKMSAADLREERSGADRYARVANLATLKNGAPDEVRFWLTWATFNPSTNGIATVGYIVTDKDWQLCRIDYAGQSTVPSGGQCESYKPRATRKQIRDDLQELAAFADFTIECNIMDGEWVTIDAVSDGRRFVVSAGNPAACAGDPAKQVAKFLNRVRVDSQHPSRR
jgi:hypothetical protein